MVKLVEAAELTDENFSKVGSVAIVRSKMSQLYGRFTVTIVSSIVISHRKIRSELKS